MSNNEFGGTGSPEEQAARIAASLRGSGLGRAVEDAAGRTKSVRLVPDLEGEITHRLSWLSEVLSGWSPDVLEDGEEFEDPAEAAAAVVAEDAVDRILATIRPTQTDPRTPSEIRVDGRWVPQSTAPAGYAGRLLDPDGRFELGPLRLVEVAEDDVITVIEICERIIGGRGPLAYVADETAASWSNSPLDENDEHREGADYARRVLGVMNLLERTPFADEHADVLVKALKYHDMDTDLVLTFDQREAYHEWITAALRDLAAAADED
jgi:hypothetical protein